MDVRQRENLNLLIKCRRNFYDLSMAKSVIIQIFSIYELYCFELINFSLKALRQETPYPYLNNLYRTMK